MKGDDVAFLKNGEKVHEPWLRNDIGRQHPHSESVRAPSDRLAKRTETDNPERGASDIADRMRKKAELVSALPRTVAHVLAISDQVSSLRENQRKDMFRNSVERVIPDIDHSDSVLPAIQLIDDVRASCRDGD